MRQTVPFVSGTGVPFKPLSVAACLSVCSGGERGVCGGARRMCCCGNELMTFRKMHDRFSIRISFIEAQGKLPGFGTESTFSIIRESMVVIN